jgi:hypothetical protein
MQIDRKDHNDLALCCFLFLYIVKIFFVLYLWGYCYNKLFVRLAIMKIGLKVINFVYCFEQYFFKYFSFFYTTAQFSLVLNERHNRKKNAVFMILFEKKYWCIKVFHTIYTYLSVIPIILTWPCFKNIIMANIINTYISNKTWNERKCKIQIAWYRMEILFSYVIKYRRSSWDLIVSL